MDPVVCTAVSKGSPLPLGSLRLLVPPIQLMTASMWQVLKRQDVMNYWNVADFVSLVMDMVPELLLHRHNVQLNLGLRARYILELCQSKLPLESDFILSHLDKIKPSDASLMKEFQEEQVMSHFPEFIEILLKDPEERKDYFGEIFPDQYGPQYDSDLQTLFWEFLCRLTQLLPVPDLEQTASWLGEDSSLMENCVQFVSEPAHMKTLLQHHIRLGHLEQHVPPSSMGDSILSSLSAAPSCRERKPKDSNDTQDGVPFVDDVTVEIITVTDYAEVELGACNDTDGIMGENCFEGTSLAGAESVLKAEEPLNPAHAPPKVTKEGPPQSHPPPGPHDCPDCDKKFRFASSLTAHRVIHTGERPHRCHECGRCFSFRQSLDRHRNTHKTARRYDCAVCGEAFRSLSARTVHKQTHMEDGAYVCPRCGRKFAWELALAKHVKTHADDLDVNAGSHEEERDVVGAEDSVALSTNDRPSDGPTSDCGNTEWVEERADNAVSPGKVRSSGRKCKPTMKIQVINLQKRMTTKKRKENPAVLKPLPFNCAEHSYGSPVVSSKDSEEAGSSLDGFSCPKCSFRHSEEAEVQQHIERVHSEAEGTKPSPADDGSHFSCQDCEKSFKFQSLLKAHQRIHTGEQPFLCAQCGRRFSFKQSLERHKHTHRSGRRYECPICGEFFKSPAAQREHKSAHMENGEYLCSECGRSFAWKSALVRHLKTHEGDGAERSHKCPRCDTGFTCASYLSRHMETHQEERAHKCNCGKSFAYQAALTAHQRTHQKERPHTCPQCGKGFIYKGGLRSHMKIHSEEMPFMCSHCGKCFKRERNMKKHERCHTRENVFRCSQCDKSFVYKATLTRHELTHSGERPYLCSDCGKGFFSHAELLKHERFHTGHKPFQCPYCGKRFTQSCYLTIHLRYHTGARPYSCTECDKSFLSANRLKRHQQTHTGEKPHVCGECGKGFRQSYHLKMHQRTHVLKLT